MKKKLLTYTALLAISFLLFTLSISCSNPVVTNIFEVDRDDCTACGKCFDVCPSGAIEYTAGEKPVIIQSRCTRCGNCANICPEDAIH